MAAEIIDGKAVAARVRERVASEVAMMPAKPGLATILVGDDPASAVYVRMKREDSAEVGIESFHHEPGGHVAPDVLADLIRSLNADERVHGILLQLPLPDHLAQDEFISLIDPAKDVDGLTSANAGLLLQGREEAMVPCTPAGVMELLREAGVELEGARAVVVGRSILVGKPLA
ncbi:MAG TPA: bifunctional 5,10-methylenetetrahydrofolate dehydrogenase/5,10-methenyltetrahydrofolate cyclohydrolase, partial [Thermoleophilaceae bacterium]|nr:bifunctional 5,10-methylenetetrahydrofolate dehydrogenase/5,10-methenyltetrahydrofolate cyclohydrolase [Thermoleophilaceae bacterium]